MKQHYALVLGSEGNLARKQRHQEKDNSCLWARTSYCFDEDAPSHLLTPARGDYAELVGHCITTRRAKEQGETTIAVRLTNGRFGSSLFSNSGRGVKLSVTSLPGSGFSPR